MHLCAPPFHLMHIPCDTTMACKVVEVAQNSALNQYVVKESLCFYMNYHYQIQHISQQLFYFSRLNMW